MTDAPVPADEAAAEDARAFEEWKATRLATVAGPSGNLALIDYHPVTDELTRPEEFPVLVRRSGGGEGILVTPLADAAVDVDGVALDGETLIGRLQADGHPLLHSGTRAADVFSLDGSDDELRIYDSASEGRSNFAGIETYPHDPALRVRGVLTRHTDIAHVPWEFTRTEDSGHTKKVPGTLTVTVRGEERPLVAFLDSGNLVLVFADGSTGAESYAPGRFLRMDPPGEEGIVEVDFNRAFVPPCGFSDFYSCPIPPRGNVFAVPIRGGERRVLWHRPRQ